MVAGLERVRRQVVLLQRCIQRLGGRLGSEHAVLDATIARGLDLSAGVAAIASGYFLLFATIHGQVWVATVAGAFLGASVGFLVWKYNPAKIFMGDGGTMFLGFMLAALRADVGGELLQIATEVETQIVDLAELVREPEIGLREGLGRTIDWFREYGDEVP